MRLLKKIFHNFFLIIIINIIIVSKSFSGNNFDETISTSILERLPTSIFATVNEEPISIYDLIQRSNLFSVSARMPIDKNFEIKILPDLISSYIDEILQTQEINKSNIINNNTLRIFGKEYEFKNYKFSNEIYLGIRPEHIHPNLKHEIEFNINIDLIENLGSDKIIYGLFKDNEIRIRTSEDLPQNNTSFSFNKDKIVFFDNKKNKI